MSFKIFLKSILILLFIFIFTVSCNPRTDLINTEEPNSNNNSISESSSKKILKIAAVSFPPFGYLDENDKYVGPGADLTREALNKLNISYELEIYPWSRMIELIKSGEVDIVLDMYYSDERTQFIDFSKSKYGVYPNVLFCNKNFDFEFDGDLKSLNKFKIGLVRDYYYGEDVKKAIDDKTIDVYISNSTEENLTSLINGRVDFALEVKSVGNLFFDKMKISDQYKSLDPPLVISYSYVAFSKANNLSDIRDQFDLVMDELRKNGRVKEVFDKYNIDY